MLRESRAPQEIIVVQRTGQDGYRKQGYFTLQTFFLGDSTLGRDVVVVQMRRMACDQNQIFDGRSLRFISHATLMPAVGCSYSRLNVEANAILMWSTAVSAVVVVVVSRAARRAASTDCFDRRRKERKTRCTREL